MGQARESLAQVRTEEAKIRSWLGLEGTADDPAPPVELAAGEGGKGSLGEEGLETVAPEARSVEAEPFGRPGGQGLAEESLSLAEDLADLAVYVEKQKEGWDAIPAISPVDGEHWISSAFGWRASPFTGAREFHSGLDMAGRKGTPVVATANGRVDQVFNDSALGRGLSIDHGNGIRTIYGHMEEVVVGKGERVTRGQRVGLMGSTGKRSTGPHLHYALKVDGHYVNPRNYLLDRTRPGTAVARK
jgi:murein DD-endopeptidase MepM/ murein hydrolase activator NlpD